MKRDIVEIRSRDYWLKVVEMLQQNLALIDVEPEVRAPFILSTIDLGNSMK